MPDCPENQEYYSCYLDRCQRTCEQFKEMTACPPLAPGCNLPGCECVDGYYKNSEGTCVPECECCKYSTMTKTTSTEGVRGNCMIYFKFPSPYVVQRVFFFFF